VLGSAFFIDSPDPAVLYNHLQTYDKDRPCEPDTCTTHRTCYLKPRPSRRGFRFFRV